jgi:hypothetical protein
VAPTTYIDKNKISEGFTENNDPILLISNSVCPVYLE